MAGVGEQTVGVGGVGKWEHPVDHRPDGPGGVERPDIPHNRFADLGFLLDGAAA